MENIDHEQVVESKVSNKKGNKLSVKFKKYKFQSQPIIIGNSAMHFYKLKQTSSSDAIEMIISSDDFKGLLENNINLQMQKTMLGNHIVENNNIYYLNYYYFDYSTILEKAIKYKTKLYINKEHLIMFHTMSAFNKRDKINRNVIKSHLESIQLLVNSLLI